MYKYIFILAVLVVGCVPATRRHFVARYISPSGSVLKEVVFYTDKPEHIPVRIGTSWSGCQYVSGIDGTIAPLGWMIELEETHREIIK